MHIGQRQEDQIILVSVAVMRVISPWMGDCNNKIGVILRSGGLSNGELKALDTRIKDKFVWGQRCMSSGGAVPVFLKEPMLSFGSNLP